MNLQEKAEKIGKKILQFTEQYSIIMRLVERRYYAIFKASCDDAGCGCTWMQETSAEYVRLSNRANFTDKGRFCALTAGIAVSVMNFVFAPEICFSGFLKRRRETPGSVCEIHEARQKFRRRKHGS